MLTFLKILRMQVRDSVLLVMTFLGCVLLISCTQTPAVPNSNTKKTTNPQTEITPSLNLSPPPISQFIRRIFEDSHGNLWLGTNGDGVFKYDGEQLIANSFDQDFNAYAVRAITEDTTGNVWFATSEGLIKYDGKVFTNYRLGDTQASNDLWSLLIDHQGLLWVGGYEGVFNFDRTKFTPFTKLPETPVDPNRGVSSTRIVHNIIQDTDHNIWFATNGGAFIYDGEKVRTIPSNDGLCNTHVNALLEDRKGNVWFATHYNGVCTWDGDTFTHYAEEDLVLGTEAWSLYEDNAGNIWFPIENSGTYKYDGFTFTKYTQADGLPSEAIQTIYEDREGTLWVGGYQGLARFNGERFIYVSALGPWD